VILVHHFTLIYRVTYSKKDIEICLFLIFFLIEGIEDYVTFFFFFGFSFFFLYIFFVFFFFFGSFFFF